MCYRFALLMLCAATVAIYQAVELTRGYMQPTGGISPKASACSFFKDCSMLSIISQVVLSVFLLMRSWQVQIYLEPQIALTVGSSCKVVSFLLAINTPIPTANATMQNPRSSFCSTKQTA